MDTNQIKQKLGEHTEKLETKTKELWTSYSPHYTSLEPWKRGLLLITLTLFLLFAIYCLTKSDKNLSSKKEVQMEERLLRQMAFFKKLRD